jgi:hypothetical protein
MSDRDAVVMIWLNQIVRAPLLIALGLAGCAGGFAGSTTSSTKLSVKPSSVTVAAGSTTAFTAVFAPTVSATGSLTWSVSPVNAGTITGAGIYTASATAGPNTIIATWTPVIATASALIIRGSARVEVLAVPQLDSMININLVQASGANQTNAVIQNGVIVGQGIPSIISIDSGGNIQVRSGFTPPTPCSGSNAVC